MAKNVELLASYWTIAGTDPHTDHEYSPVDFKDRVAAAARGGFKGFGIWHADLAHTLKKHSLKDMKKILGDNGIRHVELEFLQGWFADGEEKKASDLERKKFFDAAEVLRPHHIKVGSFVKTAVPIQKMADSFAELCADAAKRDVPIGFELMPFCDIDSIEKATALVKGAPKNGGLCLDLWHLAKLKIPYEKVATLPLDRITSIELNDGTHECPWDLHEDTINHRLYCGDGEFHPKEFVRAMLKTGYDGPWGIEVLNAEWRKKPLAENVKKAFESTAAQFPS